MPTACPYCGFENEDSAELCARCATELPVQVAIQEPGVPPLIQPEIKPALNAGSATLIFVAFVTAQFVMSIVVAIICMAAGLIDFSQAQNAEGSQELQQRIMVYAALPSVLAGGAAVLLIALWRLKGELRDRTPTGAAWVVGPPKQLFLGFGAGVLLALGYCLFSILFPPSDDTAAGPLAKMAVTPGPQQALWFSIALVFAPLIEECLFRGVMYGGYRRSLGPVWAAVLSTFLFWLLHLMEAFHFWPAMVGIMAMAIVALYYRLRHAAIGPAVAVHAGYNAVIALGAAAAPYLEK